MGTHTAREYERELLQIRQALLGMAGHVEQMIADAGQALIDRDVVLARRTIAADQAVNQAEVEIDEACLLILAKRQPMASDLRFVTLVMKMVTDLERIADLAVNICERTIDLDGAPVVIHAGIPQMTAVTQKMVRKAIEAFVERDEAKAREVIAVDDQVDELFHQVFEDLLGRMVDQPERLHDWIHVQSVAKWLERMADHATNLAELVIFMVKGRDIRHPRLRQSGP
ncbi:MAG: phosphate signaling complex protein PhoU [Myxococcales bacterium]|nr:phosphate signaling complex protein PhoU [Myxococcales bacterium]MCB9715429.1 phosphate signaling complex protein PhoU [Myxococcales bacterium]